MALPAAPVEAGGNSLLYLLLDDEGDNVPAVLRGVGSVTINGELTSALAVGTHADEDVFDTGDPLVVLGGVEGTGNTVRKLLVDVDGRLIPRAIGVYDNAGTSEYGHPLLVGRATLNGAEVGWLGVATHEVGDTVDADSGVLVVGGSNNGIAIATPTDSSGRLRTYADYVPGGTAHENVATPSTAVQLAAHACRRVVIVPDPGNSGPVYVGFADTITVNDTDATDGMVIPDAGLTLDISNTNLLWINASATADVTYMWLT